MGGMAQALASEGADPAVGARGVDGGTAAKAAAATPRAPKPARRAASKRALRKSSKPKT
jgi:hypothetical protein